MDRRKFLKTGGVLLSGTACTPALPLLTSCTPTRGERERVLSKYKWGMVIDLNKCRPDCNECMVACRRENNVALHGDRRWDVHWIRRAQVREKEPPDESWKSVLLMCNHCEKPPCAQVCPVQATYKRDDGIVIVDHHRCIGCRYCMVACPYNARYFNYKENPDWPNKDYPKRSHGVAESCNFCAHLLDQGKKPACVEACNRIKVNALCHGDLNDPESEISRLVSSEPVKRLREDLGTDPKVFYIGL